MTRVKKDKMIPKNAKNADENSMPKFHWPTAFLFYAAEGGRGGGDGMLTTYYRGAPGL